MISKISVEDKHFNNKYIACPKNNNSTKNPSFKGGLWSLALHGIQECEKNPMVNVAVIDMLSAILPRTIVESTTNWYAGFEAFRRESSGLVVNCLIPSVITLGIASGLNRFIIPGQAKMAGCWADSSLINKASDFYLNSQADDKIKDALKEILGNIEGYHGNEKIVFKEVIPTELEAYATQLRELCDSNISRKELNKRIKTMSEEIVEKTHVFENIKVGGGKEKVNASTITTLLEDSVKYFKEYQKAGNINILEFAKKSKHLVKAKSLLGLAVVLPLAASMQYLNRWMTEKASGVKGAPIYDDYGKEQNEAVKEKSKEGLLKQKFISISSMLGVSLLSMMKMPSMNMLEFKGMFPTMDQARIISTTTFASRMAAADDKNELAEATIRDIATFSGLYFLGDYAGKAAATLIEKKTGVKLLNDTNPLKGNENILKRFWHWIKEVNIKSSEEVVSNLAEELKLEGKTPNLTQKAQIKKELNKAVNLRRACQVANLGVSLLLLGLVIPIFTRKNTKKKHAETIKLVQETSSSGVNDKNSTQLGKSPTVSIR